MKRMYITQKATRMLAFVFFMISTVSCIRDEEVLPEAPFPSTAEIFTDTFVDMGSNFYFPFVGDGAKPDVFSVDENEGYESNASIRIDVPDADDPGGGFAGATFVVDGSPRNLTGYNALTFWGKASQSASLGLVGFGDPHQQASRDDIKLTTNWQQFIIPIPNPSRLEEISTLFIFAAGGIGDVPGEEVGYSFWIDELKYEYIPTIAQGRAVFQGGNNEVITAFNGQILTADQTQTIFNLPDGRDVTVDASSSYFSFVSSDPSVVSVNGNQLEVLSAGESTITASIEGLTSIGSLTIESRGNFSFAPTPARAASDVIAIFSDAYENVPVDFFNGYWEPYQTTLSDQFDVSGDHIISYYNFNFVGTQFANPTVDASDMTHIHLDVFVPGTVSAGARLQIQVRDFGANGSDGGGDDTNYIVILNNSNLVANGWAGVDIPLDGAKSNVGLIIYENLNTDLTGFYVDNIYFYR
jgi:hypothetical protein